ncbi:hypothetical protein CLV56_3569 [Mumia flava]|uniref:3-methyladenine DNA glycosylase n=1 Tax=Mumia flava TaxID=1348852 RepID=A0A2M9B7X7_9ACTN|nr:3-methyladenine DNA glycosylase [Mumia flava]PJJ54065.1 hypothetical protein CLV56_3569 [Mumia flava]
MTLPESDWTARAAAYRERAEPYVRGRLERRARGERHPVDDFLFEYYGYSPARLTRWHPGVGTLLAGDAADAYLELGAYRRFDAYGGAAYGGAVGADPARLAHRVDGLRWIRDLLALTATRPAKLDCFGLHEWAMVYRQPADAVRHEAWPLRLGSAGTDTVVETHQIRCTHHDAYRFFTDDAAPRNALRPTRANQHDLEQPGCLHAGMDLYKYAAKLVPYGDSDLMLDCFDLARDLRDLDMRASPYDLGDLGYEPVRIETADGKAAYVREQRALADRAALLRRRLLADVERVLAWCP